MSTQPLHPCTLQRTGYAPTDRTKLEAAAAMPLRRLLGLSGRLRRPLSTVASSHPPCHHTLSTAASSHPPCPALSTDASSSNPPRRRTLSTAASTLPPWVIIDGRSPVDESSSAPGALFRPVDPPRVSSISVPAHLINARERPAADSSVVQVLGGSVDAASADGHLLLTHYDILGPEGDRESWNLTADMEAERCICNPITGQLLRLPYPDGSRKRLEYHHMGLLTKAGGGGVGGDAPHRFAVAEIVHQRDRVIDRFLPEIGRWELVLGLPCKPPLKWVMEMNQETVAFGDRLWWVDLTRGAISVDPFSYRPEFRFVELPEGSSLTDFLAQFKEAPTATFMKEMGKYRRIGVSEGRLRYIEASLHDPFLLSSFVLDDEGRSWTLERQVELRQVLEDGGHPCEEGKRPPQIAVIDPLNADTIYITVGEQKHIVAVDIYQGKVIGSSPLQDGYRSLVPCVLPPALGSSQIPTYGRNPLHDFKMVTGPSSTPF
ncbi:uncharacterized protein [Aegilops tauschii subsp. strangulata]|nr:uncharacterized protein LOC109781909 [Aegilops tauschii subsp. strangulata]XP_040244756.1 uncharacterized protein LOC109781909 [Aegilops tauschii subsp. strangulata]